MSGNLRISKNLTKPLAFALGLAGASVLISPPVWASHLAREPGSFKPSLSQHFDIAQEDIPGNIDLPRENNNSIINPDRMVPPSNTPSDRNTTGDFSEPASDRDLDRSLSAADREFIDRAARDNLMEIYLGQLAAQRGSSEVVRRYGRQMVEEHARVNNELMQLACQLGVSLPANMGEDNGARVEQLSRLSGTEFDRAYMQEMVNAHNQDIALFYRQAQIGQNRDLQLWASRRLPNLQEHLARARQMTAERF